MRDIPANLIIDSVDAGVGAFIDLFEADLQPFGGDLIRFHSGTNGYYGNVIWKGNQYQAYPIAVEGFESKNEGTYARPTMAVANVIDRDQYTDTPSRTYHLRGLIVDVPDNYDPIVRTYSGLWTGGFKLY